MNELEFGVTITKERSNKRPKIKYCDYISCSDISVNIGETLLSICEDTPGEIIEMLAEPEHCFNMYDEIPAINIIRDFIRICVEEKNTSKIAVLSLIKQLGNLNLKRRIYSSYGVANLPFTDNLYELVKYLNKNNKTFSVTIAYQIFSYTDICLASLLIISELHKTIQKCCECGNLYIGGLQSVVCDRKNEYNQYKGCKFLRKKKAYDKFREKSSSTRYIRLYNRFSARAKTAKKYIDIRNNFVAGWQQTNENFSHLPNEEKDKKLTEYLDEWELK